jgi:hypothetical protein
VATTNGGPVDIVNTLSNGILVDPTDADKVAEALLELLTNGTTWDKYSSNGVTNINAYSWSSHCMKCLSAIEVEKVSGQGCKLPAEPCYLLGLGQPPLVAATGTATSTQHGFCASQQPLPHGSLAGS